MNSIIRMVRLGDGILGLIGLVVHLVYRICLGVILLGTCILLFGMSIVRPWWNGVILGVIVIVACICDCIVFCMHV